MLRPCPLPPRVAELQRTRWAQKASAQTRRRGQKDIDTSAATQPKCQQQGRGDAGEKASRQSDGCRLGGKLAGERRVCLLASVASRAARPSSDHAPAARRERFSFRSRAGETTKATDGHAGSARPAAVPRREGGGAHVGEGGQGWLQSGPRGSARQTSKNAFKALRPIPRRVGAGSDAQSRQPPCRAPREDARGSSARARSPSTGLRRGVRRERRLPAFPGASALHLVTSRRAPRSSTTRAARSSAPARARPAGGTVAGETRADARCALSRWEAGTEREGQGLREIRRA